MSNQVRNNNPDHPRGLFEQTHGQRIRGVIHFRGQFLYFQGHRRAYIGMVVERPRNR